MKIFVATALLAVVLVAQAQAGVVKRDIFQSAWDNLQDFTDTTFHKTFPKLVSLGRAGVTAIRHLAIQFTEDMLGVLKKEYQMAKNAVSNVIHSDLFDEAVNSLIPLIDNQHTVDACVIVCDSTAKQTTDDMIEDIADATCPAICKGALTKMRHAAETLEEKL
ncbi:hypothetical protein RRG08_019438 [Elysia crispata]|uniref:Uncharacterized protein n=1 Tax=Elysia crispata TaxID=231223 RepID=A0AAE0Z3E8_9GAST|nr:hypothetical protein RRG08_019438 [Elysia crispata]